VVAARDEATSLSTLLDNLLQQNYGDYEVVIVNDRSTDETATILDAWQKRSGRLRVVNVSEVPEGRTPKMHALGLGIAASKGDIITLTDADCRVPPTWIEGLTASFTADVGAVIGYVGLRAAHNTWLEHVQALDYFAMMATMAGATKLGQPIGAAGANIAYRRAAYDAVGGFEAMPLGAVADDMVMLQQVLDHTDWRVVFCDDERAFITTDAEPTLELLFNQRVRWMAGGQEVLRHNPALLTTGMLIGTLNGILMSFPLLLGRRDLRRALLYAVVGRTLADALHLGVAAVHFRRVELLWYLPLWILLQIPYTTLLPLYSASRKWSWK
jgi:cellulose synthase/poly-beta-1,6-N-acetylglucosamine synthase-like glycosyltransferase